MPDFVHGSERRPLVPGMSLFDVAGELSVVVPASCKKTGRCHECVVEIRSGADQLTPRTDEEAFLGSTFRLACQARVAYTDRDVEFSVLRRRLRILLAPTSSAPTPKSTQPCASSTATLLRTMGRT
ncbi:MAG: 2Fe-2S iron-sulfur cluster binding domain-containing protein [Chloroflexota bacterium]